MPIIRVSTSVALSSRRIAGSFGAVLVALGAAEVIVPPAISFPIDVAAAAAAVV
jgi:hypothetical protein